MRQYLTQPRSCGAADLRAWRIDRTAPFEFSSFQTWCLRPSASRTSPSGSLNSGETACVLSVVGFALTTKPLVSHPRANFRCRRIKACSGHVVKYDNSTSPYFTLL